MKQPIRALLLLLIAAHAAHAATAQTAAPAAPAPQPAALQQQAAASLRRVEQLTESIRDIDAGLEKRATKIVDTLKTLGDSNESQTRVARMKQQVIEFLRKQLGDYSRRRSQLRAELDNPHRVIPEETLTADIAIIDRHVDRRIEQIVALGGSFGTHKDYDKYKVSGTTWNGYTEYRLNEDYKQNKRDTRRAGEEKGKLFNAIDETVKRLEFSNRALRGRLAGQSAASAKRIQADIARNETLIATLQGDRNSLVSPAAETLRPLGRKEATDIENRIKQAADAARADQLKMINLYNELNRERYKLQTLNVALSTAKKGSS